MSYIFFEMVSEMIRLLESLALPSGGGGGGATDGQRWTGDAFSKRHIHRTLKLNSPRHVYGIDD